MGIPSAFAVILLTVVIPAASPLAQPQRLSEGSNDAIGGLDADQWLVLTRDLADALLDSAADRYGNVHTPLWIGIIDPATHRLVTQKPENFMIYRDAEDYVMTAQGCNLYRDMPALRALCALSDATGDAKYRDAVEAYLKFYLGECPSKTTGLLPAGEHMSYNCVRDRVDAVRHEIEHNPPDWPLLWEANPEAVQRAIEAIYDCHIYDKEQFFYDRHGAYYTGAFDPMPVRGSYIKHSGLFAYSFLFLYSKTGDPKHLEWAHGAADLYWSRRDPQTNLVPGYVGPGAMENTTRTQLLLAYYLLHAARIEHDPFFVERGLGMVDSYLKYGYDAERGMFAQSLDIRTGEAAIAPTDTPWTAKETAMFYEVLAVWKAYEITGKEEYLDVVCACLRHAAEAPLPEDLDPYTAGQWLELYLDAYGGTHNRQYLHCARALADWAAHRLVRNGIILENASGCVYHNSTCPGELLAAWLRLHAVEAAEPLHWRAPDAVRTDAGAIPVAVRGRNIEVSWRFHDGEGGVAAVDSPGTATLSIPIPDQAAEGPVHLGFAPAGSDAWPADETDVLVARNPEGPAFSEWDVPGWIMADEALEGRVRVSDPSGVTRVECICTLPSGEEVRVPCRAIEPGSSDCAFAIPALADKAGESLTISIEATAGSAWPITRRSEPKEVIVAQPADLSTADGATVPAVAARHPWVSTEGLPAMILSPFIQVLAKEESAPRAKVDCVVEYDAARALEAWMHGIAAYRWLDSRWEPVPGATADAQSNHVRVSCEEGGIYVVAGPPRLVWRRSFNGALLSSPSVMRIDAGGTRAIVLDTGDADGMLYVLDAQGETLWTYDLDDDQPYVAIADFDGDSIDEIALGGPKLTLLNSDGSVRWEAPLQHSGTPAAGDVDGDGALDVVAASADGPLAAFAADGHKLWEATVPEGWRPTPALGNVDGEAGLDVFFGKKDAYYAFNGSGGAALWATPVEGEVLNAPAVADLDRDGRDEVVFFTRTDEKGTLYALDNDGAVLWHVPINRDSDWSPVICDFDGDGELQIIAQEVRATRFGVYSARGELLRAIETPGRTLQTPVIADFDGDGRLDLLSAFDIAMQVRAYANDGRVLWSYTPESITMAGAKVKGNGSMLVADLDGDGWLEVAAGDDLTWLQMFKTDTPCAPWAVVSGQFHGDARRGGRYPAGNK